MADDLDAALALPPAPAEESEASASDSSDDSGSDAASDSGDSQQGGKAGGDAADGDSEDSDAAARRRRPGKKLGKRRAKAPAPAKAKPAAKAAGRKRKREAAMDDEARDLAVERRMKRFFETAEEGEEEEEEEGEQGTRQDILDRLRREAKEMREREERALKPEELAAALDEKYRTGAYREAEDVDYGAEGAGGIAEQANLPDMRDPKLWMLKCKEGSEPAIMISLLNKYIVKAEQGERLGIMSAVTTGKGVIFVESYREAQVRAAVAGITDLYGWKPDAIKLVPIGQMTAVLRVTATRDVYKRGMFVRGTRGQYKGDLAQVVDVMDSGARILIRMIPRINLAILALPPEQRKGFKGRAGPRPPQRYYDRAEIEEATGRRDLIDPGRNMAKWGGLQMDVFGGNAYGRDGMLYKEVKPVWITPHGTAPTVDEVSKFRPRKDGPEDSEEGGDSAGKSTEDQLLESLQAAKSSGSTEDGKALEAGDSVIVVKGDLTNLTGRVVVVNPGGTFTLQPSAESAALLGLSAKLEIPIEDVVKTFNAGDHVKVLKGVYAGETGTVLAVKQAVNEPGVVEALTAYIAVLVLDSSLKTVEVFVRDLTRSSEVVTSTTNLEGYELYDLVEIPGVTDGQPQAGVIVALRQRDVDVLLVTDMVKAMPVQNLRGKINFRGASATAVDVSGSALSTSDVVRVMNGEHKDKTGTVKHIHKSFLFLHNYTQHKNAGMFVVRSRYVMLAGSKARPASADGSAGPGPAMSSAAGRGRGRGSTNVGKTVKVLRGRWKGRIGLVRNETETHYSVELHQAQQKHVTVEKKDAVVVGDEHGAVGGGAHGASAPTPFMGHGATPFLGGQTPAFGAGGATPAGNMTTYGGATPMYGAAATPMYGAAATPMYGAGSATPMYGAGSATPYYGAGSQTPMYGSRTPLIHPGARTPMYGGATPLHPSAGGAAMGAQTVEEAVQFVRTQAGLADDLDVTWYASNVMVNIVQGAYAGKSGSIVTATTTAPQATVRLITGQVVQVQIVDMRPQKPKDKGQYVRILSGAHAGKVAQVTLTTEEEGGATEVGVEVPTGMEILPVNVVVVVQKA